MKKIALEELVIGDRVTFDGEDGIQAGYVADIKRDIGNGRPYAWIELEHQWPGMFQAVPIENVLTSDGFGSGVPYQASETQSGILCE